MSKRKDGPPAESLDKMEITPLGAGNEVGRSCVLMSYKGKNVLFDCGIHPGYAGFTSLPFFDVIDTSTIDVLLVTHFHLDHAASLPYFLEKTDFKGRVFMTHATKAVYYLLLSDFVKVSKVATEDMLFDEKDISRSMEKIETLDFHQTQEVNGIKFWCYTAGHVLGAAMFMVDIAGVRVLYTGDYSREEDRHLKAAEMPPFSPELCIIESTYGVQLHEHREERERRFTDLVVQTVLQGGKVLIPAFALGRAQELLLILDEYWSMHTEVQHVPIYYASPLANKCMSVYQTYVNAMNDRIRQQFEQTNPFEFKHIRFLKTVKDFDTEGPAVVMASPGGLQSGLSRQLFDEWCQDKKNTCLIPGYVVEGTLAKTLLSEPKEVALSSGLVVPLRMRVRYISFSAHADYAQTSEFLTELKPPNIVLVHGEATEMGRLKGKLTTLFEDQGSKVLTPKNCQTVEFFFKGEKMAKAVGKLAEKLPKEGSSMSGLLVKKGFAYQLLAPDDLPIYTQLSTGTILQRQAVPYLGSFGILTQRLSQMYDDVATATDSEFHAVHVHDAVTVFLEASNRVVLQWSSDPVNDVIADSIVALILRLGKSDGWALSEPKVGGSEHDSKVGSRDPRVKREDKVEAKGLGRLVSTDAGEKLEGGESMEYGKDSEPNPNPNPREAKLMHSLLENLFGEVDMDEEGKKWVVKVDGNVAVVDESGSLIDCDDENLRSRVEEALKRIRAALNPLSIQ